MHIDWDGQHGAVTGPISASLTAVSTAWAADVFHVNPLWGLGVAGAGLVGTHIAGVRKKLHGATLGLRAATWIAAGGWCSWAAVAEGPWTGNALAALAAGAVGMGTAMAGAHHVEEKHAEKEAAAKAEAERTSLDGKRKKIAEEWDARLARVCMGSVVKIVAVEEWPSGGGYTLGGECSGGTKWKDIKAHEDSLAADAKLPEGCGVEVQSGAHRGAVLLDVSTVNAFIDDCPYPADYSPLSINDPVAYGVHRDGSPAQVGKRQLTGLVAARKGAGKTNFMNVDIANDCRMVDQLPWVIDLNGGGLALPWLHAWHEAGRPGRPPIDWVADTPEKVLAMARAALAITLARKPGYKKLEIAANDDKLPVSAQVPAIGIKCDEAAELYSPRARKNEILKEAGDILIRVIELARAVAVNAILAALRVTQDVLSEPQVLKQAGLRVGMQSDDAELSYLNGWHDKVTAEDLPYPGCGCMKIAEQPARPFKAYRITPKEIRECVVATANLHPELDELSRRAAGPAYENRWAGTDHLFGIGDLPEPSDEGEGDEDEYEGEGGWARPASGSGVTAGWGSEPIDTGVQAELDQADAARDSLREAAAAASDRDPDLEQQFQQILEAGGALWKPPAADVPSCTGQPMPTAGVTDDARWPMVFAIVAKAGPGGIGPTAICETYEAMNPGRPGPSRSAVTEWLKAEPKIHQPASGKYALRTEES